MIGGVVGVMSLGPQGNKAVDEEEVAHIKYEHHKREAKVPHIASSDALAVEHAVMVWVVNANITQVTVLSILFDVDRALLAELKSFFVLLRKERPLLTGSSPHFIDFGWNTRVAQ